MAKNKKLSELTLNELYAEKKKSRGILKGFGIVALITCAILVFFATKSKNYAIITVSCSSFLFLLPIMAR